MPKQENKNMADEEAAEQEWHSNIINNDSLVFNLFQVWIA